MIKRLLRILPWLAFCATWQGAAAGSLSEAEFKAAAIYSILQFVQWPVTALPANGTLRLCQLSAGPLMPELARLAGRQVHQRILVVRRIEDSVEDAAQCEAIWVDSDRLGALGRMAAAARKRPLLLLGEGPDATDRGAMVGLSLEKGRAQLRVDNDSARDAGLTINSRLLQLANNMAERP